VFNYLGYYIYILYRNWNIAEFWSEYWQRSVLYSSCDS